MQGIFFECRASCHRLTFTDSESSMHEYLSVVKCAGLELSSLNSAAGCSPNGCCVVDSTCGLANVYVDTGYTIQLMSYDLQVTTQIV